MNLAYKLNKVNYMKTRSVSLNIFLQNCQYETRGTNDIKIISKQCKRPLNPIPIF